MMGTKPALISSSFLQHAMYAMHDYYLCILHELEKQGHALTILLLVDISCSKYTVWSKIVNMQSYPQRMRLQRRLYRIYLFSWFFVFVSGVNVSIFAKLFFFKYWKCVFLDKEKISPAVFLYFDRIIIPIFFKIHKKIFLQSTLVWDELLFLFLINCIFYIKPPSVPSQTIYLKISRELQNLIVFSTLANL